MGNPTHTILMDCKPTAIVIIWLVQYTHIYIDNSQK